MSRPFSPLIATALMAAASPAVAQTWPAGVVVASGVRALESEARAYAPNDQSMAFAWRASTTPAARMPIALTNPALAPTRIASHDEAPLKVDIRAKVEWRDDQGVRASAGRVSYKRRF